MKKVIILIVIILVIGGLWYWATTRSSMFEEEGELATAERGRVEVPISASGEARERQRVEIKAEASGKVIEIAVEEGQIVEPGQLLLKIDEEEELRNVEKAQAAVSQAENSLEISRIAHEQSTEDSTFNVDKAEAALEIAQARYALSEVEYNHYKKLYEQGNANLREYERAQSEYLSSKAQLASARFDLERAKTTGPRNVTRNAREIELAQARLNSAQYTLRDAERRLRKTKISNSYHSACRVVRIYVTEGQVISSAISVVGAGTPVMELADISAMEVEAQVDESDIDRVVQMFKEGQAERLAGKVGDAPAAGEDETRYRDEVVVRFDALPREEFPGRIVEIAQKPRNLAQIITYDVRIRLNKHDEVESIRLGMQGTVEFAPVAEEGLCVPYEAVHRRGRDRYVVKLPNPEDERGDPIEREVEAGLTDGQKVIIRSGLEPDEEFYVKEPTRIRAED